MDDGINQLSTARKHNLQYQARVQELERSAAAVAERRAARQGRANTAARRTFLDTSEEAVFEEDFREHHASLGRYRALAIAAVLVTLVVAAIGIAPHLLSSLNETAPQVIPGTQGVDAEVGPGPAWNVRLGPGTSFSIVAVLEPEQDVVVDCLVNGWARLASPHHGSYVWEAGLILNAAAPVCSKS